MKRLIISFVCLSILTGCVVTTKTRTPVTSQSIMKDYLSQVNTHDGVNRKEAILLAQSQVVFRGYDQHYYLDRPKLAFEKPDRYGIKFYPRHKTMNVNEQYPTILVVIKKSDGEARFYHKDTEKD